MPCGCKNKKQVEKKIETPKEEIQQMAHVAIDTINEIGALVDNFNENAEGRERVQKFMKDTFGLMVGTYCDTICRKRLKSKLELLKKQII